MKPWWLASALLLANVSAAQGPKALREEFRNPSLRYRMNVNRHSVPREERGIEPLCAVWRRDACAPVAQELLSCDRQRIRCLISRVQAGYMDEPQIVKAAGSTLCFENVNTPEEFAAAELLA